MADIYQLINQISRFAPLIPLMVYLIVYVIKNQPLLITHKWLMGAIWFSIISEISSYFLGEITGNNLPLYHIYVIVEISILATVFHHSYSHLLKKEYLRILLGCFGILSILNVCFFQAPTEFPSLTRFSEGLILLFLSLRYFFMVLKELKIKNLESTFAFWFATAVLVYFSSNLLLFIYSNYVTIEGPEAFWQIWAMHGILNILLYLFYAIALWQKE